jgi:phage shock protein A
MALITRLARLLRADLNAVMDRLEEPGLLLAESVREMEATLANDEAALDRLRRQRDRTKARRDQLIQALADIGDELAVCLDADADDLARGLLRRRLETTRARDQLVRQADELDGHIQALTGRIRTRCEQLAATRVRAETALADDRHTSATAAGNARWADPPPVVTDSDVEVALLAEKRRRGAA